MVAEVYLGSQFEAESVEIISLARTATGLQVVFRILSDSTSLNQRITPSAAPLASALIARSELGQDGLEAIFVTTQGERLPVNLFKP